MERREKAKTPQDASYEVEVLNPGNPDAKWEEKLVTNAKVN